MKHKRRRAIIRQLHKRYHKAIREVWDKDWDSALYLSIELNDKVLKVNR